MSLLKIKFEFLEDIFEINLFNKKNIDLWVLQPEINTEPLTVSRWLNWSMFIVSCWSSMTTRLSLDRPTSTTGVFLATETVRSLSWFRTSTRRRQSLLASPTWWGDSLLLSVNHCSGKQCLSNLHIHVSNLKLVSSLAYGIWLRFRNLKNSTFFV